MYDQSFDSIRFDHGSSRGKTEFSFQCKEEQGVDFDSNASIEFPQPQPTPVT